MVGDDGKAPGSRWGGATGSTAGSMRRYCWASALMTAARAARVVWTSSLRWCDGEWRGKSELSMMSSYVYSNVCCRTMICACS